MQLVLGSYSYPSPELVTRKGGIKWFLKTLRKFNKTCHIIIFCYKDHTSDEFTKIIEKYDAKIILHDIKYIHFDDRFIHFYQYLANNVNYNEILLTDMDDVVFTNDPFSISYNDIYITCESHKLSGDIPPQGYRYSGNHNWPSSINLNWISQADRYFKVNNREKYYDKYVLNTGVILGNYHSIMDYLKFYVKINNFDSTNRIIGQGVWMYYVYNILDANFIKHKNTESRIVTCVHIEPEKGDYVEKEDCPKIDFSKPLCNKYNQEYIIIHMYNRFSNTTKDGMKILENILTTKDINEYL